MKRLVSVLSMAATVAVVGLVAQASFAELLMDRGLPTTGIYAVDGSGNVDWSTRTNISVGCYDYKEPTINYYPGYGNVVDMDGDDFSLPAASGSLPNYNVTNVRVWLTRDGTNDFSTYFNSVSLYMAQGDGSITPLTLASSTPTVTTVPFGSSHYLWQLDFPVDFTAPAGAFCSFAVFADGQACPYNYDGNSENYYMAYLEAIAQGYSSGYPNDGSDGLVKDFYAPIGNSSWDPDGDYSGIFAGSWSTTYWGGVPPTDYNVQVFGAAVPEPASVVLLACCGLAALLAGAAR